MTDITIVVAWGMAALAMSLVFAGRARIEVVRAISYGGMSVFAAHSVGIVITAPVASHIGDTLEMVAFTWLMFATLAVCIRGAYRIVAGKQPTLIGS